MIGGGLMPKITLRMVLLDMDVGHVTMRECPIEGCEGVLDENDECPICDERHTKGLAYWWPLWQGEQVAGLHERGDGDELLRLGARSVGRGWGFFEE